MDAFSAHPRPDHLRTIVAQWEIELKRWRVLRIPCAYLYILRNASSAPSVAYSRSAPAMSALAMDPRASRYACYAPRACT